MAGISRTTNYAKDAPMIEHIDLSAKKPQSIAEGTVTTALGEAEGTRVNVSVYELEPSKTLNVSPVGRTQVVYVLDGEGVEISHTSGSETTSHAAPRRSGIYLEPGEQATIKASDSAVKLLDVSVPKYDAKKGKPSPKGYFFEEAKLQSLVDEKAIRERTFWVNTETGLSDSWDLQLGRMYYAPEGYSPRHVHNRSETGNVDPEHFYFVEKGTGRVEHDDGEFAVGPGSLVLFPAGEWHQFLASESGLDYIEFQGPYDFATTMDHDPQGKNWYIKGSEDESGKRKLWVQS